jgi:hypothetical protein
MNLSKDSEVFKIYDSSLVKDCGSVNAVILFCELESTRRRLGVSEFFYTSKQLMKDLGFKRRELESAQKKLVAKELLSYKVIGYLAGRKTYYKLNDEKIKKVFKKAKKQLENVKRYKPELVEKCGSVNAVILYLELQRLHEIKGYYMEFCITNKVLQSHLNFTRGQLHIAKKKLIENELISCRLISTIMYYTVQ